MKRIHRRGSVIRWLYHKRRKSQSLPGEIFNEYAVQRNAERNEIICYAPFVNMYFSAEGNVLSCCFNRKNILGRCNENPAGLWMGNPVSMLRKAILHDDLGMGCGICETMLRERNYKGTGAIVYDKMSLGNAMPSMLEFELSNTCNLQCIMCSPRFSSAIARHEQQDVLPAGLYGNSFVESLSPLLPTLKIAKFLGGEPFLINIYFDIWEKIIAANPRCLLFVQTNATVMNDNIRNLLERGNFRIGISLESLHSITWETIRRGGHFDVMMENFSFFLDHARRHDYTLGASVCFMHQNRLEIPEMIEKFNKLGVLVNFNTVWSPPECALWNRSAAELQKLIDIYESVSLSRDTDISRANADAFQGILKQLQAWCQQAYEFEKNTAAESDDVGSDSFDQRLFRIFMDTILKAMSEIDPVVREKISPEEAERMLLWVMQNAPVGFPVNTAMHDAILHSYAREILHNCSIMKKEELLQDLVRKYNFSSSAGQRPGVKKFPGDP
jgi:MoaA/NifB/PqqE/SkfB family radical SAM enzyme